MHDGDSFHMSQYTNYWIDENYVPIFCNSLVNPQVNNIILNVLGSMIRAVYNNGRQVENGEDLGDSVFQTRYQIYVSYIKSLYKSVPRLQISLI